MSGYDQHQAPVYPPPGQAYPPPQGYPAQPPAGYPGSDPYANQQQQTPVETKSRGDGFWKGCCAALCCCCVLDACF